MDNKKLQINYLSALQHKNVLLWANLVLVIVVLLLGINAASKKERIVLIPSHLTESAEVAYKQASESYKKPFALSTSLLIGNVNANNAKWVAEQLGGVFSADLYRGLRNKVLEEAEYLRTSGKSYMFVPGKIMFEEETNKFFVTGEQTRTSVNNNATKVEVTYEYEIIITNGLPKIIHYDRYEGGPHTVTWHRNDERRRRREELRNKEQ